MTVERVLGGGGWQGGLATLVRAVVRGGHTVIPYCGLLEALSGLKLALRRHVASSSTREGGSANVSRGNVPAG